jgi:GNAT superfamily N-acetyltransferase
LVQQERVAAVGWLAMNRSDRSLWADFVPLRPGEALLYGAWVRPDLRGAGLHTRLLRHRLSVASATRGVTSTIITVMSRNTVSMHNSRKLGWQPIGDLTVLNFLTLHRGSRTQGPV